MDPIPRSRIIRQESDEGSSVRLYPYPTLNQTYSTQVGYLTETMDDFITPDFSRISASGIIVVNPLNHVIEEEICPGTGLYQAYKSGNLLEEISSDNLNKHFLTTYPASSLGYPSLGTFDMAALEQKARNNALSQIDSTPYSFAEDVFELRETLRFLRNPVKALRGLSRAFSKDVNRLTAKRKYLKRSKAVADVWLQYRFAVSPLVRSSVALVKAALDKKLERPKRRTARGYANDVYSSNTNEEHKGHCYWNRTCDDSISFRSGVVYEVSNPVIDWRYKYGLRLKDVPETIWAVLPYSFMVDRVVNISRTVRGLTNLLDPSIKIKGGWSGYRRTSLRSTSLVKQVTSGWQFQITPQTSMFRQNTKIREVWEPSLIDTVPTINIKGLVDDSTKIADLGALIIQNFR